MKTHWNPGTLINPLPVVMVSCGATAEEYNIVTVAWTGTTCSNPPMCYIGLRPERHSYDIIKRNKSFVINLTTKKLSFATDWCGVKSGRQFNKFSEMKLIPIPAAKVSAPVIAESPVNIECVVKDIIEQGTHHLFLSEVVNIQVDTNFIDAKTGAFDISKTGLIAYANGFYYELGAAIGKFGFSVMKKKKKRKT